MSFLALVLGCVFSGNTLLACPNKPLDHDLVTKPIIQQEQPFLEGKATWYDYKLNGKWRSKSHSTCALRIKERHKHYKVCSNTTGKCVRCYHNDYGPKEETGKVIDLSSYAFKQLGVPLSRGVTEVEIYLDE